MHTQTLLFSLLSASLASAHFTIRHPAPFGTSASKQDEGPCGGYSLDESTAITDFHVDGEAISYSSGHPSVHVLFRVVEGNKADGDDLKWTQAFPIVEQFGAGDFCEPMVTVPRSYVGKRGILQVVQNAVDGMLYACAYVNFVSGKNTNLPSSCVNGTGVDAQLSSDSSLEALMGGGDEDPSTTSPAPSPSQTPSSATVKSQSIVACIAGVAAAVIFNFAL